MSKKSKKNWRDKAVKALMNDFIESYDDDELQNNYNEFQRELDDAKKQHNKLVNMVNDNNAKIRTLKDSLLNQVMNGVTSETVINEIKKRESRDESLRQSVNDKLNTIESNRKLIEKYETLTEKKLFTWWKALRAVEPNIPEWLSWKREYDKKIF